MREKLFRSYFMFMFENMVSPFILKVTKFMINIIILINKYVYHMCILFAS